MAPADRIRRVKAHIGEYDWHELSDDEIDEHVANLLNNGYTIVPASIPPSLLRQLLKTADKLIEEEGAIQFLLPAKAECFCELATAPNVLRIVKKLIGEDCLLSSTALRSPGPSTPEQEFHVSEISKRLIVYFLTCMVRLNNNNNPRQTTCCMGASFSRGHCSISSRWLPLLLWAILMQRMGAQS